MVFQVDNGKKIEEILDLKKTIAYIEFTADTANYVGLFGLVIEFTQSVNKSELETVLETARTIKNGDSHYKQDDRYNGNIYSRSGFWTEFLAELTNAEAIHASEKSNQDKIDEARKDLTSAISNLIKKEHANTTLLYEATQDAKRYSNSNSYTPATWAAFSEAKDEADALMDSMFQGGKPTDANKPSANNEIKKKAEKLRSAMAALDPDAAPAAFYGANLLLLAASLCVGFPVLRDGLNGLRGRSSSETMPALAAVAALVQAVTAMLNANVYRGTTGISLLSGMAALGLFLALLGSRVMLAAVKGGYELVTNGVEFEGAYRAKDKDLLRALARDLEQKDPWVLLSRPMKEADGFVEQSLSERASERRARKVSYILLGVALLSGVLFLLAGAGWNKAAAAMAAVLCMGAPLSSTLIAGVASLRLQRAAAAVGAVVPGWQAIEQLGGIDTLQIDADDLFTADSAQLEDIRIFKGGRIDRAILYAASVLNESHGTLKGLFRQIVEERTDILFPVKDLEQHHGLGFSAWCDNNRILIGTRRYLEQEGVPLPDEEYEMQHSKNGELQILYLAVSGNLHAMFVLKYVGGRNVARGLAVLQKENIRLLVTCQDPSLTAHHITEAYRLPEGMITVLDQEQCNAIKAAPEDPEDTCCMIHLKAFASLTGGLQAADQAQNAESSATTVQMVSVLFSIIIAALLTSAGSIWELSVATVLMYQAAWSALSIAVCALKQHN